MNIINYISFGRDIWREIFSHLSFYERQRIRRICKDWNLWIKNHKSFWPLNEKIYSSIISNVTTGKYKQDRFKVNHDVNRMQLGFAVILSSVKLKDKQDYGIYIYSKTDFQLLFTLKIDVHEMELSENHLLIEDSEESFWLLSFEHTIDPKESVKLVDKRKVYQNFGDELSFIELSYPYMLNGFYSVLDLRTMQNIFEKKEIEKPKEFKNVSLSDNFLCIKIGRKPRKEFWFYNIKNLDQSPFKIIREDKIKITYKLRENNFFIGREEDSITFIDCYNLTTRKKTTTSVSKTGLFEIHSEYVLFEDYPDRLDYYIWNSDYTKLLFYQFSDKIDYQIHSFHSSIPFIMFYTEPNKLFVYSKKTREKILSITFEDKRPTILGDQLSKVYLCTSSLYKTISGKKDTYIRILDFS